MYFYGGTVSLIIKHKQKQEQDPYVDTPVNSNIFLLCENIICLYWEYWGCQSSQLIICVAKWKTKRIKWHFYNPSLNMCILY